MRHRPHTLHRCNPVSEYDRRGYERLMAAIRQGDPDLEPVESSFASGLVTWMVQNKPIEESPEIHPNSIIWALVENDSARWN